MNTELTPEQIAVLRVLHCFPVLEYAGRGIVMPAPLLETAQQMRAIIHFGMVEEFLFFQNKPPKDEQGNPSAVFRLTAHGMDVRANIEAEEIRAADGVYQEWFASGAQEAAILPKEEGLLTATQFMVLRYIAEAGGQVYFTDKRPDLLKAAEELEGLGFTKRLVSGYPAFYVTHEGRVRESKEQACWNHFLYLSRERKIKGWKP